eukprot:PhM_4_TR17867/c0_g1_i1/m.61718
MFRITRFGLVNRNYKNWKALRKRYTNADNFHAQIKARERERSNANNNVSTNTGAGGVPSPAERFIYEKERERAPRGALRFHQVQGAGDGESLQLDPNANFTPRDMILHGSDAWKHAEAPNPVTPLAMQKMREGNWWPSAPTYSEKKKALRELIHPDDMSPSARKFAFSVEYWIRRDLKAVPHPFSDNIDFEQLVIERVIASRRSQVVHIVWSTVHPGARRELEPHIEKLAFWVRRKIRQRLKRIPNIPIVKFVYNESTSLPTKMPRQLRAELKKHLSVFDLDLESKVKEIKSMDTLQHRLKHVPWYMPYLWAKDQRVARDAQMKADYDEYTKRKGTAAEPKQHALWLQSQKPQYLK